MKGYDSWNIMNFFFGSSAKCRKKIEDMKINHFSEDSDGFHRKDITLRSVYDNRIA